MEFWFQLILKNYWKFFVNKKIMRFKLVLVWMGRSNSLKEKLTNQFVKILFNKILLLLRRSVSAKKSINYMEISFRLIYAI